LAEAAGAGISVRMPRMAVIIGGIYEMTRATGIYAGRDSGGE